MRNSAAFTIVELLIVVVVIAILAAITIISYTGIQQRANNVSIMTAVNQTIKVIQSYVSTTGKAPGASTSCLTYTSGCSTVSGSTYASSSVFNENIATVGSIPRTIPTSGSDHYGIIYVYSASRVVDGNNNPIVIFYWLYGTNQACGVSGLIADPNAASTTTTTAASTYSNDAGSGKTLCAVAIPSP